MKRILSFLVLFASSLAFGTTTNLKLPRNRNTGSLCEQVNISGTLTDIFCLSSSSISLGQSGNTGTVAINGATQVTRSTDQNSLFTTTGTATAAQVDVRSGNGTTSARFSYFTSESLETSPQRWDWGMYGDKNWTLRDQTGARSPIIVAQSDGSATFSANLGAGTSPSFRLDVSGPNTNDVPVIRGVKGSASQYTGTDGQNWGTVLLQDSVGTDPVGVQMRNSTIYSYWGPDRGTSDQVVRTNLSGTPVTGLRIKSDGTAVLGGLAFSGADATSSSDCTTGNCTLTENYGGGISTIAHTGTGAYTVNFTASFWSAAPVCIPTLSRGSSQVCVLNGTASTSSVAITCFTTSTAAAVDTRPAILCMGQRTN